LSPGRFAKLLMGQSVTAGPTSAATYQLRHPLGSRASRADHLFGVGQAILRIGQLSAQIEP